MWLFSLWHSQSAAAWVQAIGSIIAIAVAIRVPYSLHRKARNDAETERRLKARSLSLRLLPILLILEPSVKRAMRAATEGFFDPAAVSVEVPESLKSSTDTVYLLGNEAGPAVQQLLAFLDEHEWELARLNLDIQSGQIPEEIPMRQAIACRLARINRVLESATERVRRIHNGG